MHLRSLQNKQYKEIAKALNQPLDVIMEEVEIIKQLDPRPGQKGDRVHGPAQHRRHRIQRKLGLELRDALDSIGIDATYNPGTKIEILVPDFRGRMDIALRLISECPPDVFNHNIESVPRLYKAIRPGSDYQHSLDLLKRFKTERPDISTKCGLMVGLGETKEEVLAVLDDLRAHGVDLVTIGQYLQPSKNHARVERFVTPEEFEEYAAHGRALGFRSIWSGPMVRSSYHADLQFAGVAVDAVKRTRAEQA